MKSQICKILDIEFPLVAFSHCRDVVAAVSKAGGMGVLGAVGLSPEKLEIELNWIDENIDIGVYAQNTYPKKTDKSVGIGKKDVPIKLGSVEINPGDWIYIDSNGWIISKKKLEL